MQAIEQAYERTLNNIPEDTCAHFAYHYIPCHELNTICKKVRAVTVFPRRYRCLMDPGLAGDWPTLWSCGMADEAEPDAPNTKGRGPPPHPHTHGDPSNCGGQAQLKMLCLFLQQPAV